MADRTAQPPGGTGVNPIYTGARFLWNAVEPNVNALDASTGSGAKGTSTSGADGTYQRYNNTDGATTFSVTVPTGAYTLVLVLAYPAASQGGGGGQPIFSTPSGGVRNETFTTGGGVYQALIHTGVAAADQVIIGVSGFDSEAWVYVARYDGTTLYQYVKEPSGTETTDSQTISYSVGSATQVALGSPNNAATGGGLYAAMLVNGDLGDTEVQAILDNPWRMFEPEGGGPLDLTQTSAVAVSTTVTVSGDFATTVPLDLTQTGAVSIGTSLAISGEFAYSSTNLALTQTSPVSVSTSLAFSGDLSYSSAAVTWDLTPPIEQPIAVTIGISGDFSTEIRVPFDIAQTAAVGIATSITLSGDFSYSDVPQETYGIVQKLTGKLTGSLTRGM